MIRQARRDELVKTVSSRLIAQPGIDMDAVILKPAKFALAVELIVDALLADAGAKK